MLANSPLQRCYFKSQTKKDCSYPYKELCGCGVVFKLHKASLKYGKSRQMLILNLLILARYRYSRGYVSTGETEF